MTSRTPRSKVVFAVMAVAMVAVAVLVVVFVPRDQQDKAIPTSTVPGAVVRARITIDTIDAVRGSMKVRLAAGPTDRPFPPEGVTVLTDADGISAVKVPAGSGSQDTTLDVPLNYGDISAYPFDEYRAELRIKAVVGNPTRLSTEADATAVPLEVLLLNASTGFAIEANATEDSNGGIIRFAFERSAPTKGWASVMMAIFWLLTFAVMSVTTLVVLGLREWESRHLAWLATMIFAFASFRATAPGTPPVGVYLDFAAFFWAEALVAISLMTLVVFYLRRLPDPDHHPADEVGSERASAPDTPDTSAEPDAEQRDAKQRDG